MQHFFFTSGTDGQPFCGGWTEIEAPDMSTACAIFRAYHPDRHEGLLNCADVYTEATFKKTGMDGPEGNFGHHCRERITVIRVIND